MNEKILELLGKIVEQNEKVLEQNHQFISFLERRDALVAERTKLEVEHFKYLNAEDKLRAEESEMAMKEWAKHPGALEDFMREAVLTKISRVAEDRSWREKRKV